MISLKKIPKVSHSEMRDIAARICRDYLHGAWKTTSAEEIQLRRISGGLSNFLYYVSLPESSVLPGDNIHSSTTSTSSSPSCANKRPRKDSDNNNNNNAVRLQLDEENLLCGGREPKEVLLRIYGQSHGEHALEAMLTESVVFALLSERRLGPKLHGIFPGGRIEQYIPARPLKTNELANRRISMKISEKMSEIHCLDIPISKEPDWIWKTAHRWLISIENMFNNNTTTSSSSSGSGGRSENVAKEEIKTRLRKIDLKGEVQWLRDQLKDESFLVVFSHNDLQEGNILIREDRARNQVEITFADTSETTLSDFEESSNRLDAILIGQEGNGCASAEELKNRAKRNEKLSRKRNNSGQGVDKDKEGAVVVVPSNPNPQRKAEVEDEEEQEETEEEEPELIFIDFEYCSYNYRGFDLANHFLEWTFDYTNKDYPFFFHRKAQFPDEDQKRAFLDTYLRTSHRIKGLGAVQEAPTPEELQLVEREIDFFQCASHLFWTLWAIVYCDQEIEFGYWEYADCRLSEYFEAKEKYLLRYKKGISASGGCVAMQQPIQENGLRASSVSV